MVGFQTKLKHGEQTRIFRMIPGLENATLRAARRPAPQHLHQFAAPAGRAVAAEGAAASALRRPGHGRRRLCRKRRHRACWRAASPPRNCWARPPPPPPTTAFGALLAHITGGADAKTFQPMNVNFGLFPEPPARPRGQGPQAGDVASARSPISTVWLGQTAQSSSGERHRFDKLRVSGLSQRLMLQPVEACGQRGARYPPPERRAEQRDLAAVESSTSLRGSRR